MVEVSLYKVFRSNHIIQFQSEIIRQELFIIPVIP